MFNVPFRQKPTLAQTRIETHVVTVFEGVAEFPGYKQKVRIRGAAPKKRRDIRISQQGKVHRKKRLLHRGDVAPDDIDAVFRRNRAQSQTEVVQPRQRQISREYGACQSDTRGSPHGGDVADIPLCKFFPRQSGGGGFGKMHPQDYSVACGKYASFKIFRCNYGAIVPGSKRIGGNRRTETQTYAVYQGFFPNSGDVSSFAKRFHSEAKSNATLAQLKSECAIMGEIMLELFSYANTSITPMAARGTKAKRFA